MTTLPEEAVKAACARINELSKGNNVTIPDVVEMLTAAAPHLASVRVKAVDTLGLVKALSNLAGNRHSDGVSSIVSAADRSAIIDTCYDLMIASRQQPSASRAAVLEEAAIFEALEECETYFENRSDADHDETGFVPNEEMRILVSVRAAIRALASHPVADKPDEAAGAGEGWPTGEYEVDYEIICNGEWVAGSTDLNDAKHYAAVYSPDGKIEIVEARTYRRPLTSAPSGGDRHGE